MTCKIILFFYFITKLFAAYLLLHTINIIINLLLFINFVKRLRHNFTDNIYCTFILHFKFIE